MAELARLLLDHTDPLGASILISADDPTSVVGGVAAPVPSLLLQRTTGTVFVKVGAGNSQWARLSRSDVIDVRNVGAKGDERVVTDAAMTSGSAVLTSATAAFTADDVGKLASVKGAATPLTGAGTLTATAGAGTFSTSQVGIIANASIVVVAGVSYTVSGFNNTTGATLSGAPTFGASAFTILAPLATTILSYTNATAVVLAANAGRTVSGARLSYGTDDTTVVQAALTAAAGLVPVLFPRGVYLLSTTLSVPPNSVLLGVGRGSVLKRRGAITAGVSGRILYNAAGVGWSSGTTTDTNITLRSLRLSMNSEGGVIRPTSSRLYATASFYGMTGVYLDDVTFDEPLQFNLDCDTCTTVRVTKHIVTGQYASTPTGNVDGVHFTNCVDYAIEDAQIDTGDDLVAVTTASGGRASTKGVIRNIRGSSKEANGVKIGTEGAGAFSVTDWEIDGVKFESGDPTLATGSAVVIGDIGTAGVVVGKGLVSNVRGRNCGNVIDLNKQCQQIAVTNVRGSATSGHIVSVLDSDRIALSQITAEDAGVPVTGAAQNNINGVNISSSTRISLDGVDVSTARLWGLQVIACTDVSLDRVTAYGNGRQTGTADRGGIRINASSKVTVGAGCRALDNGSSFTAYGVLVDGSCSDIVIHADPAQFGGITKQILNNANTGVHLQPGAPLAWIEFNTAASSVTYDASTQKNVSNVTRTANGDYTLTMGVSFSTNDSVVVLGSASDGVSTSTLVFKPQTINATTAGGTIRIATTNGAGALAQPTKVYVAVFGRIGSVP